MYESRARRCRSSRRARRGPRASGGGTRSPSASTRAAARAARPSAPSRPCAGASCGRLGRTAGTRIGSAPSAATTTRSARTRPRGVCRTNAAPSRCAERRRDGAVLEDARADRLGAVGERADPARRLHRAVLGGDVARTARAAQLDGKVVARHELGGEAVLVQRLEVLEQVRALLRVDGEAQAAALLEEVARAELIGDREHVALRVDRRGVDPPRELVPEPPAGVVVERRRAGDHEPAVPAARARSRGARLEHDRGGAELRQVPGGRDAADAGTDHADVDVEVNLERCASVVPVVLPEWRPRGHRREGRRKLAVPTRSARAPELEDVHLRGLAPARGRPARARRVRGARRDRGGAAGRLPRQRRGPLEPRAPLPGLARVVHDVVVPRACRSCGCGRRGVHERDRGHDQATCR